MLLFELEHTHAFERLNLSEAVGHALSLSFAEDDLKAKRQVRELLAAAMPQEAWEVESSAELGRREELRRRELERRARERREQLEGSEQEKGAS